MADDDTRGAVATADEDSVRSLPLGLADTLDANGYPKDMTLAEKRAAGAPGTPTANAAPPPALAVPVMPAPRPATVPAAATAPIIAPPPSVQPRAAGIPTLARPEDATVEIAPGTSPTGIGRPVPGASGAYVIPGHAAGTPATGNGVTPAHSAIAGLWTKAGNINNPFLRVLAKVGTGILGAGDVAAEAAFPRFAAVAPGSILSTDIRNRQAQEQADRATQFGIEQQNADTARMGETEKANAPGKPFTLSEAQGQAYQDLLHGNNSQPRINPVTQKPFTPQEALQEIQKSPAAPKLTQGEQKVVPESVTGMNAQIDNIFKTAKLPPTERTAYQITPEDTNSSAKQKIDAANALSNMDLAQRKVAEEFAHNAKVEQDKLKDKKAGSIKAVVGFDQNGNEVFTSESDAEKMGLTGVTAANAQMVTQVSAARTLAGMFETKSDDVSHMGLIPLVEKLDQEGKLGPLASRYNDFIAGKYGAGDPDFEALRVKMGLMTTKLMQMHVGQRGGSFMLEHFEDLANAKKMNAQTLLAGLRSEDAYVHASELSPAKTSKGGATPNVGAIEDGYRFKGGDPSKQSNWEKVK